MKILISSLTYPLKNGVTNSINLSVDFLEKRGHVIMILAPEYDLGKVRDGHIVVPSSLIGKLFLQLFGKEERMFSVGSCSFIKDIFASFQPDVAWLHTVSWLPNMFEKIMIKSRVGTVLTYHTMVEEYGRMYAGKIGAKQMISRSKKIGNTVDQIIAPSEMIKNRLQEYGVRKPIHVIPTGIVSAKKYISKVEVCNKFQIDRSKRILLYVGRISKEKNISTLLRMLSFLAKKSDEYILLMVGPGDIETSSFEANQMGLGKRVVFTGPLAADEAKSIYGGSDAFVFASQTETQGLVIGEAMIAKIPIVALRSPIQQEIYPDRFSVVCDSPEAMARDVISLFENQDRLRGMVAAAFEFVKQNFTPEIMSERQEKVLFSALESSNNNY